MSAAVITRTPSVWRVTVSRAQIANWMSCGLPGNASIFRIKFATIFCADTVLAHFATPASTGWRDRVGETGQQAPRHQFLRNAVTTTSTRY